MKKQLKGKVISIAMQKTIIVSVERKFSHPTYLKVMTKHKKYKVHNELEGIQKGDYVAIEETRPISKEKHHRVISKIEINKK